MASLCKQGSACSEFTCQSVNCCDYCGRDSMDEWICDGKLHRVCMVHYESLIRGIPVCVHGIKCANSACTRIHPSCEHCGETAVKNVGDSGVCKMHYMSITTNTPVCIHGVSCKEACVNLHPICDDCESRASREWYGEGEFHKSCENCVV
jgi:hypothetical protein